MSINLPGHLNQSARSKEADRSGPDDIRPSTLGRAFGQCSDEGFAYPHIESLGSQQAYLYVRDYMGEIECEERRRRKAGHRRNRCGPELFRDGERVTRDVVTA